GHLTGSDAVPATYGELEIAAAIARRGRRGRLCTSLRAAAEEAGPFGDLLRWDEDDGIAIEAEAGDEPGVVALPLVEDAARHHLAGDVAAGRIADADQGVMTAPEDGIDRGDRMDTVADQQVPRRADRPVFRGPAVEDFRHPERTLVDHRMDAE